MEDNDDDREPPSKRERYDGKKRPLLAEEKDLLLLEAPPKKKSLWVYPQSKITSDLIVPGPAPPPFVYPPKKTQVVKRPDKRREIPISTADEEEESYFRDEHSLYLKAGLASQSKFYSNSEKKEKPFNKEEEEKRARAKLNWRARLKAALNRPMHKKKAIEFVVRRKPGFVFSAKEEAEERGNPTKQPRVEDEDEEVDITTIKRIRPRSPPADIQFENFLEVEFQQPASTPTKKKVKKVLAILDNPVEDYFTGVRAVGHTPLGEEGEEEPTIQDLITQGNFEMVHADISNQKGKKRIPRRIGGHRIAHEEEDDQPIPNNPTLITAVPGMFKITMGASRKEGVRTFTPTTGDEMSEVIDLERENVVVNNTKSLSYTTNNGEIISSYKAGVGNWNKNYHIVVKRFINFNQNYRGISVDSAELVTMFEEDLIDLLTNGQLFTISGVSLNFKYKLYDNDTDIISATNWGVVPEVILPEISSTMIVQSAIILAAEVRSLLSKRAGYNNSAYIGSIKYTIINRVGIYTQLMGKKAKKSTNIDNFGSCSTEKKSPHSNRWIGPYLVYSSQSTGGTCFFASITHSIRTVGRKGNNEKKAPKSFKIGAATNPQAMMNTVNKRLEGKKLPLLVGGVGAADWANIMGVCDNKFTVTIYEYHDDNSIHTIYNSNPEGEEHKQNAKILLHENHYFSYIGRCPPGVDFKTGKCLNCYNLHFSTIPCKCAPCLFCMRYIIDHTNHTCKAETLTFVNNMIALDYHKRSLTAYIEFPLEVHATNTIIYDFETYPDSTFYEHQPYALGYNFIQNTETRGIIYGTDCVDKWLDLLASYPVGNYVLVGFNSANYDVHLMLRCLLMKKSIPVFIKQGSASLTKLEFNLGGSTFTSLDLMKFFSGYISLNKALAAYDIPTQKDDFDHELMANIRDPYHKDYVVHTGHEEHEFEYWDCESDAKKYLAQDIECTTLLFYKMLYGFYEMLGVDFRKFMTLSHLSFELWKATVFVNRSQGALRWPFEFKRPTKNNCIWMYAPSNQLYQDGVKAMYGGRVFPIKRCFKSSNYDAIINGQLKWGNLKEDYILALDAVSLYCSVMSNYTYPHGKTNQYQHHEIAWINNQIKKDGANWKSKVCFLALVEFKANPYVIIPTLPRKSVKFDEHGKATASGLSWTLMDGVEWYTNVDLERALRDGYSVTVIKGYYWVKQDYIFKDFNNLFWKLKQEGKLTGNRVKELQGKQGPNSCYGKFGQKTIKDRIKIVTCENEWMDFIQHHALKNILPITEDDESVTGVCLSGVELDNTPIHKPNFISCFILSYSRLQMDKMMEPLWQRPFNAETFNHNLEVAPFYGDTDSIHVKINDSTKEILNNIKPTEMGWLANDLKEDDGKIIKAFYIKPKTYCIEYLTRENKIKRMTKTKGIPKGLVTFEMFENVFKPEALDVEFNNLSAFRATINKHMPGYDPFTLYTIKYKRTFKKDLWLGRIFLTNTPEQMSVPFGSAHPIAANFSIKTPEIDEDDTDYMILLSLHDE